MYIYICIDRALRSSNSTLLYNIHNIHIHILCCSTFKVSMGFTRQRNTNVEDGVAPPSFVDGATVAT